ncbi:hypothetical protein K0U00_43455, partial [Paenibacillus sepulcri]|nr:hypothetical protein [Paenibacillus sepulcri]
LPGNLRLRLFDPVITIPFAAAFIASVVNCLHMLLFSQSPLRFGTLFLIWSGFGVCAAILWYKKSRVYERIAASGAFPPIQSHRQRLVRTAIVSLSIAALLAIIILSGMNASRLPDRINMADRGGHPQHGADPASMISVDSLNIPRSGALDRIWRFGCGNPSFG